MLVCAVLRVYSLGETYHVFFCVDSFCFAVDAPLFLSFIQCLIE